MMCVTPTSQKDPLAGSVIFGSCNDEENEKELAEAGKRQRRRRERPSVKRQWWGDCQPHVVMLREALLSSAPDIAVLGPLHGCFSYYMTHFHNEVLSSTYAKTMIFGADASPLESSFMWMGGWRPTSALVLVYSLMGVQLENALQNVRRGRKMLVGPTTSVLTPRQLSVMTSLQKFTQHAEMKLSKKHAILQMLIGDQDMLAAVMLDAASPVSNDSSRFKRATEKRMLRFRRLLVQAEDLRLHTLKDLLSLLTPIQAAQCGVAVFELCASMGEMGNTTLKKVPVIAVFPASAVLPKTAMLPLRSVVADSPRQANDVETFFCDASSSQYFLTPSDVVRNNLSNETGLLVPSCSSNSSSSPPPHPFSPQDFDRVDCGKSLSTTQPIEEDFSPSRRDAVLRTAKHSNDEFFQERLNLSSQLTRMSSLSIASSAGRRPPRSHHSAADEQKIISNRLFILSPATSDVTVQTCGLDTAELEPTFNIQASLPCDGGSRPESSTPESPTPPERQLDNLLTEPLSNKEWSSIRYQNRATLPMESRPSGLKMS